MCMTAGNERVSEAISELKASYYLNQCTAVREVYASKITGFAQMGGLR